MRNCFNGKVEAYEGRENPELKSRQHNSKTRFASRHRAWSVMGEINGIPNACS